MLTVTRAAVRGRHLDRRRRPHIPGKGPPGRLATLLAGWPETVPGLTLHRFCGSAQQAITVAAMGVGSGHQDLVVAGGVESMSRWDLAAGSVTIDGGNPAFRERFPTVPQGISADLIAT